MIVKGKSRAASRALGVYLSSQGENERVQLIEVRGTVAQDPLGAILEMDAYALGTRCEKPLYHAIINPEPPHVLTPEQRIEAIDALEKKLGLDGHARVVVAHLKNDREHLHVTWSRIDLDRMRTVSDSHNYRKHEEVARDLERRFGHDRVQGAHHEREGVKRPDRTPSRSELRQAERTGVKGKEVKAEITALFRASDGAEAFASALENAGYVLAQGDRRDFVIVDRAGGVHSLARRIDGVKAAELREFMRPLDRGALPTTEQAQEIQAARARGETPTRDQIAWEDALAAAAIVKDRTAGDEAERRKRERLADHKENKLEAAYARGDDYVTQSHAAQRDHRRRQKALNEAFQLDRDEEHLARTETPRRQNEERKAADEVARLQAPSAASGDREGAFDNVEITDRMARLLGEADDGPRDRGLSERDGPDRQREAPGGGRTRSR